MELPSSAEGLRARKCSRQEELILWDLASGRELRRLNGHRSGIVAARFTADGERVIASSGDAEIFVDSLPIADTRPGITATDMLVWDVRTGEIRQRFEGMEDDAFALAIASDRTSVLTASFYQNRAEMWDLESGKLLQQLEGHREGVHAVSMSADGRRALTASCDDSMMLWDLTTGKRLAVLNGQASDVMAVTMSADGRTALSAGRDGSLMLWDIVDTEQLRRFHGHGDQVWDTTFSPDGRLAVSSSGAPSPTVRTKDSSVRIWDMTTGAQMRSVPIQLDAIIQLAVSPDGQTLLAAGTGPSIQVSDFASGAQLGQLQGHGGPVTSLEFTPDSVRAVSASVDGTVILWDVPGLRPLRRMNAHGEGLWSLAVGPRWEDRAVGFGR